MEKPEKRKGLRNPKQSMPTLAAGALGLAITGPLAAGVATQIEQPAKIEQVKQSGAHDVVAQVMKAKPGTERFKKFEKAVFDYIHPDKSPVPVDQIIAKMQTLAMAAGQAGADEEVRELILENYVSWVKFKNEKKNETNGDIVTSSIN